MVSTVFEAVASAMPTHAQCSLKSSRVGRGCDVHIDLPKLLGKLISSKNIFSIL